MDESGRGPDRETERLAREVADQDRLLPGEEAAMRSEHLDDARHWVRVYEELFVFKQALLGTLLEQRGHVHQEGRDEVQNDEILLTREADRLSRRLQYWQNEVANPTRRTP